MLACSSNLHGGNNYNNVINDLVGNLVSYKHLTVIQFITVVYREDSLKQLKPSTDTTRTLHV